MKYHFSVTGIGFCVGNMNNHEDLIEAITTQKKPARQKSEPTAQYAIKEALKYKDENPVMMISSAEISQDILAEFKIAETRNIGRFQQMLEETVKVFEGNQYGNILLMVQDKEGYAAALLSKQSQRCLAQVSMNTQCSSTKEEVAAMDAMMQFITAVVEIRYAFKLDGSVKEGMHIWHWMEKRELERTIDGITFHMKEAELVNKAVFESKRYILPVIFDTIEEAKENLRCLQRDVAQHGLYKAMQKRVADLKAGKRAENVIVLLAENYDSLKSQIDDLLAKSGQLLSEGFQWKSSTGSLYIKKTAQTPKVVFMNPPGGMFNSKPFYRYVSKLYDFVEDTFQPSRGVFFNESPNELMKRYLEEINITFVVMYLLETIGIQPDYLSGTSMGEVVFDFIYVAMNNKKSEAEDIHHAMSSLETTMRNVLENRKAQEEAYFGHEVDLTKYYLKCDTEEVKKAVAKYDDVFVIIEGSPKDVLLCGEKASCEKLAKELDCIAIELGDPMYVHTPVLEPEFEKIKAKVVDAGLYLDVDDLPYQLFSTYLKKNMDSSSEMFAENIAAIMTRTVNYTEAVKTLYDQDARVFIDLSTTQLCGNWAKNTLSQYKDVEVVSIYENKDTADYLLELGAAMLAGNVRFDFEKLYSRLTFACDEPVEAVLEKEVKTMTKENITTTDTVDVQQMLQQYIVNQMALNQKAYEMYLDAENKLFGQIMAAYAQKQPVETPVAAAPAPVSAPKKNYLWDREQAIEMTENSMAAVLGEQYKKVDQYPIRARMPLPPFMFVSRIVSIDAEYGVLRPSSIVSEYELDEDYVFRMGDNQISPLIGSEASHIGIFLLAYMGIDALYDGKLSYRAIGSEQITYSERPFLVGDTMRTVLRINRFVQNGSTVLVFFTFETYNGEELIFVTDTTGGFFTKEELTSNKGVISPKNPLQKVEPREFPHFSDTARTSYNKEQVAAFYSANYDACFENLRKPKLKENYYYPHDLKMIDYVTKIDYNGGMYGRGIICGEKQLTPDMWPFKAHFKNDPVFPAIIMTDGASQLGVFLFVHAGMLSKFNNTAITSIKGNCVKSKFRGQARHGYSTLRYELHIKDVVETENSISVYYDAKIFNDGVQIIQVDSYGLKIVGDPN